MQLKMDKIYKSEQNQMGFPGHLEPDLIVNNKYKINHFRRFGYFLVHWKNGKYEVSQRMLLLYYLLWYAGTAGIFIFAFALIKVFRPDDYKDKVDDHIEAAFVGFLLGFLPSWGIYLLREYNTNLPQILMIISRYENTLFYKEFKKTETQRSSLYKKINSLNSSTISYIEGFREDDHNDEEDEVNIKTEIIAKEQWWLVRYGPFVGMLLSSVICTILIIISFSSDVSKSLMEKSEYSLKTLKREMPYFIMTVLYPLKPCVSLWFCIFLLEWQRKVYECIRYFLRNIKKTTSATESHKQEIEQAVFAIKEVQKAFILLNQKIFQKTIVMDFILFVILGVFCSWKILQLYTFFAYIIPLSIIFGHIFLVCKWSNDLMQEYNETIEVMNEMTDDVVEKLRKELDKYPPQVLAFGGFRVNYSMMTAVIVFIFSLIEVYGMVWPETVEECYYYQDGYRINQTLCIKDKINKGLFKNGLLELRLK